MSLYIFILLESVRNILSNCLSFLELTSGLNFLYKNLISFLNFLSVSFRLRAISGITISETWPFRLRSRYRVLHADAAILAL